MAQKLRLKMGENELELEGDENFIKSHLKDFLEKVLSTKSVQSSKQETDLPGKIIQSATMKGKKLSPAELMREKKPNGGTETLIVLAKYLEEHRGLSEFTQMDINKVAGEAKSKNIAGTYYSLACKQGLLNKIKQGRYSLTLSGEDAVLSMPAVKGK